MEQRGREGTNFHEIFLLVLRGFKISVILIAWENSRILAHTTEFKLMPLGPHRRLL